MEIDIPLDQLPEHILEEIFSNLSRRKHLRLVCKTFKNIIDNSAKLLKNKWLLVNETLAFDSRTIHHPFQNLIIVRISTDEMKWIRNYQHKDRIKAIKFRFGEKEAIRSAKSLQYVLSNFNSLEMICFEMDEESDPVYSSFSQKIRLIPNNSSKLKTLKVDYYSDHYNNILKMFSNISTIKNLIIKNYEVLKFPKKNIWNLEKLIVLNGDGVIDVKSLNFLKSQQSTLKELAFPSEIGYAYRIMCNLPNLKNLTCGIVDHEIDKSMLLPNSELQRLIIQNYCDSFDDTIMIVLNHYCNIKYLGILSDYTSHYDFEPLIFDLKFENLTHLMLKGVASFKFLGTNRLNNIKVLGLKCNRNDEVFFYSKYLNENLKNVEKLSLDFQRVQGIFLVLQKCPNLSELNLEIDEWNKEQNDTFISRINNILAVTPNLKYLGINRKNLKEQKMTIKKLSDQIINKNVCLKSYISFKSMVAKDWGKKHVQYLSL